MKDQVINSIFNSVIRVSDIEILPKRQGIYAYILARRKGLKEFGNIGEVIYVGLAEKSLHGRDTMNHLASGQTGWSSFRRSLGAILKDELNLKAIKRDKDGTKIRADKYKFTDEGEIRLTKWMKNNLKFGYWENETPMEKGNLRKLEENVILSLKPKLDLDRRTRHKNPLAKTLDDYREVCKEEVRSNFQ